jgi:hypothetical protein
MAPVINVRQIAKDVENFWLSQSTIGFLPIAFKGIINDTITFKIVRQTSYSLTLSSVYSAASEHMSSFKRITQNSTTSYFNDINDKSTISTHGKMYDFRTYLNSNNLAGKYEIYSPVSAYWN